MIESPPSSPLKHRSRLRNLLRYGVVTLVVVAAGVFLARRQIGDVLAHQLDDRLSAAGIFISWKSASWVPGPGIRLHDLALYRDAAKRDRLALLAHVTAIKGDRGWDQWDKLSVTMVDARLTLGNGENETNLERLHLQLLIQPGRAELTECHGSLQGLRIEAKGEHVRTAKVASANAEVGAPPAVRDQDLFGDVNLDWLKTVKTWVKIQPEKEEPVLKLEFHPQTAGKGMDLAMTLDGTKFQWLGQKWDLIQATVKTSIGDKQSPVVIERMRIGQAGRTGELTGAFDPVGGVLTIEKLDSGIDVLALTRALAPDAVTSLTGISTTGGLRISGAGEIPVANPEQSRWDGRVELDGALVYQAGGRHVALQKPSFALLMEKQVVSLAGFQAGLWGGNLDMPMTKIHLPAAEAKPRFDTKVTLKNARLQSGVDSLGAAQKQPGIVQFDWSGGGGFDLPSISGSGSLSIREAAFYRIPLLGPLHVVFDKLTPGFGRDVASTMTARNRMAGGILHIENLKLDSKLTRIEANGSIDLTRQYAHLTAKAKLQGIAGLATALLSALLKVEGEGPVHDVRWKLDKVPGIDMIGDAAGVVGKTGGMVIDEAASVVKKTTGTAADAVKGTGNAVKGLFKLPGKLLPGK